MRRAAARWSAPSGLRFFTSEIPRALPWAGMGRTFGPGEVCFPGRYRLEIRTRLAIRENEVDTDASSCGSLVRPFRAQVLYVRNSQGVALGWDGTDLRSWRRLFSYAIRENGVNAKVKLQTAKLLGTGRLTYGTILPE